MTGKRDLTADAVYAERIGNLSLLDDEFMSKIFEDEEGVRSMNTAWEKMRKEERENGLAAGRAEGQIKSKTEIAQNMRSEGMTAELISKVTGLTVDEIKRLTK